MRCRRQRVERVLLPIRSVVDVIDIVAQEAVESGALNALLQWLHMTQQNAGSAGFESSIDEVAIAAKACTVDRSRNWTSPWIKVDRTLLDSTLSFLSKLEGVFLGHRVWAVRVQRDRQVS